LDTIIDYNIIKEQPILGIGLGNIKEYKKYSAKYAGGGSSSNGLTNYISKIGLLGFIITLYPFIFINIKRTKNKLILLCNGLTLISQGIILSPIFLLSMSLLNQKE
jgi:O-antigen ligase